MSYTAKTRDRNRLAVNAVTGVITAASLTSVGWLTGAAADDFAQDQAEQEAQQQAQARQTQADYAAALAKSQRPQKPTLRQRPTRTRVITRYVRAVGTSSVVGSGGTVTSSSSSASAGFSGPGLSGGSSGGASGGSSGPAPAPPPPPPPPAPSSGS